MKNELLHYDWMIREAAPKAPRIFSKPTSKLQETEWDLLDRLAVVTQDLKMPRDELNRLYTTYVRPENRHTSLE
jgi:hypothetical protein